MERRLPETDPHLRMPVKSILREAMRCKKLVEELLTFSRINTRGREPICLATVLRNTAPLLQARARAQDTTLEFDVAPGAPRTMGDRTQLEQVVINLGVNALDALRQGGQVSFRVAPDGAQHVVIAVEDDGPGIPEQVRPRIFEPFFTTKEVGKGTGLGLSLSYEIVQQHGGCFEVDTEVGRGTTMRVRLPSCLT